MKIRIKGNSIRYRLTKTDVRTLKENQLVTETTLIPPGNSFKYQLKSEACEAIHATFEDNCITIILPLEKAAILTETDEITIKNTIENGEPDGLFLLIEKDLQCLDPTHEDQSDMYENPATSC